MYGQSLAETLFRKNMSRHSWIKDVSMFVFYVSCNMECIWEIWIWEPPMIFVRMCESWISWCSLLGSGSFQRSPAMHLPCHQQHYHLSPVSSYPPSLSVTCLTGGAHLTYFWMMGHTPTGTWASFNRCVALSWCHRRDSIRLLCEFKEKLLPSYPSTYSRVEDKRSAWLDKETELQRRTM